MKSKTRIAIQGKGRLSNDSCAFLQAKGFEFFRKDRADVACCTNQNAEILFLRDDDIPQYVANQVAEFGIVGENVIKENEYDVQIVQKLPFGKCALVIAVPENSPIKCVTDLEGERIATTYPNQLRKFLSENATNAAIIPLKGSAEIAPRLNLADAVCDLMQSGTTLRVNNLRLLTSICNFQAVLISSPDQESFL